MLKIDKIKETCEKWVDAGFGECKAPLSCAEMLAVIEHIEKLERLSGNYEGAI